MEHEHEHEHEHESNGDDNGDEVIRVYFDLSSMAHVRGVLALAETLGLTMRMAPVGRARRRGAMPGPAEPGEPIPQIKKGASYRIGDPSKLPEDTEAAERFPVVQRLIERAGGELPYRKLLTTFQRNAHIDARRAGFTLSFMVRSGALVAV